MHCFLAEKRLKMAENGQKTAFFACFCLFLTDFDEKLLTFSQKLLSFSKKLLSFCQVGPETANFLCETANFFPKLLSFWSKVVVFFQKVTFFTLFTVKTTGHSAATLVVGLHQAQRARPGPKGRPIGLRPSAWAGSIRSSFLFHHK